MIKYLICFSSLLFCCSLHSQKEVKFFVYGGPSITTINSLIAGEIQFFLIPLRPFYEINYHVGGGADLALNSHLNLRTALNYERKGAAEEGFNKANHTYGDFIQLPLSLMVKPLKEKDINFEFGLGVNYLVNVKNLLITALPWRSVEIAAIVGFEFKLYDNIYFGTRLIEPFNDLQGNITSSSGSRSLLTEKSQSFQFSVAYKIN